MARTEALVNPTLVRWARDTAGYTVTQTAQHLRRPVDDVRAWEAGRLRPSIAQARKLAELYKRPLGLFYLDQPPEEEAPVPDYRLGPKAGVAVVSPALRWAVRRLHSLREAALDLADEDLDAAFPLFPVRASLTDDPGKVAARLRNALGVDTAEQLGWTTPAHAWRAWRDAMERIGCLVFVLERLDKDEVDGLSLSEQRAPVIGINGAVEYVSRRIFTLMHELAHVALNNGGICALEDSAASIEPFCNKVAAALLLPKAAFLERAGLAGGERRPARWDDAKIVALARDFCVSRQAVFVRLVTLDHATKAEYDDWRRRHRARQEAEPRAEKRAGGPTFYQTYFHRMSLPYLRQAFDAYETERISLNELSDYLGVKPSTALVLEERLAKRLRRIAL